MGFVNHMAAGSILDYILPPPAPHGVGDAAAGRGAGSDTWWWQLHVAMAAVHVILHGWWKLARKPPFL